MSKELYVFKSEFGPIYIEAEGEPMGASTLPVSSKSNKPKEKGKFEDTLANVKSMAQTLRKSLNEVMADEVTVEAGAKFKTGTNLLVFSGGSDVEFKISLKWIKGPDPDLAAK